jgi:hypothetical protein
MENESAKFPGEPASRRMARSIDSAVKQQATLAQKIQQAMRDVAKALGGPFTYAQCRCEDPAFAEFKFAKDEDVKAAKKMRSESEVEKLLSEELAKGSVTPDVTGMKVYFMLKD